MNIGVGTDVGKIRKVNQDAYFYSENKELPLFVVADGMGGHNAGEIASCLAIKTIKNNFFSLQDYLLNKDISIPHFINSTLKKANKEILNKSLEKEELNGMGTTVTLTFVEGSKVYVGHIGDSRAYLLRNNKLIQITTDHSLVRELVKNGSITEKEALNHPQRNIITRALGTDKELKVDILSKNIKRNDILILCTDGLTNMVDKKMIKEILQTNCDLQKASDKLIEIANEFGGVDNITVLLIKID